MRGGARKPAAPATRNTLYIVPRQRIESGHSHHRGIVRRMSHASTFDEVVETARSIDPDVIEALSDELVSLRQAIVCRRPVSHPKLQRNSTKW